MPPWSEERKAAHAAKRAAEMQAALESYKKECEAWEATHNETYEEYLKNWKPPPIPPETQAKYDIEMNHLRDWLDLTQPGTADELLKNGAKKITGKKFVSFVAYRLEVEKKITPDGELSMLAGHELFELACEAYTKLTGDYFQWYDEIAFTQAFRAWTGLYSYDYYIQCEKEEIARQKALEASNAVASGSGTKRPAEEALEDEADHKKVKNEDSPERCGKEEIDAQVEVKVEKEKVEEFSKKEAKVGAVSSLENSVKEEEDALMCKETDFKIKTEVSVEDGEREIEVKTETKESVKIESEGSMQMKDHSKDGLTSDPKHSEHAIVKNETKSSIGNVTKRVGKDSNKDWQKVRVKQEKWV